MRLRNRTRLFSVLLGLTLGVRPVESGIPIGFPAQEYTQLLNYAQLVNSALTEAQQLVTQTHAYIEQIRNGIALPSQIWSSVQGDMTQIAEIVKVGQGLAFSLSNLDAQFRNTYTGYTPPGTPFFQQYQSWSQTSLDTTRGTLNGAGLIWQQLQSEKGLLAYLQSRSQSANGQMQALEVGNQVAVEQVGQLQKLRELMLADVQSKQAYQAYHVQKDMQQQAFQNNFFAPGKAGRDGVAF